MSEVPTIDEKICEIRSLIVKWRVEIEMDKYLQEYDKNIISIIIEYYPFDL